MKQIHASIITIGDELLIGQVIDTNSAWMAQELNKCGIAIKHRIAVGDNWNDIWQALDMEQQRSQIILITGGLGPTADDITKPLLCDYFNSKLVLNDQVLQHVTYLFEEVFKRPLTDRNRKQAEVPEACTVISNKRGTAPGMWFEKNERIFVSMPGVPHEMKGMMTDEVIPRLLQRFQFPTILHRTLLTAGVGESTLADMIEPWEKNLPLHIRLAYLPNYGMVRLRLTGSGPDAALLEAELNTQFAALQDLVKDYLVTNRDEKPEQVVGRLLKTYKQTLGLAESCTGGLIASLITANPGASAYFQGGVVSYSNHSKEKILQVHPSTINEHGAVSEETIKEMVTGVFHRLHTDYALAVSGIMGPDGGTSEKPVGTVWIAVASKREIITRKFQFRFDRERNTFLTAMHALNMLRQLIESSHPRTDQ
jgi:nicotinamide-nucleotide amidase